MILWKQEGRPTLQMSEFFFFCWNFKTFYFLAVLLSSYNLPRIFDILSVFYLENSKMVQTILSAWNTLVTARHVSPWHWYSTVWLSLRISSEALHKKRMKACIYTGLLWASLKFYHCGMNIKKNSWVRGEWDLIIVSGVIISLRARKTPTRFFIFFC